jgi:hypothetical protein
MTVSLKIIGAIFLTLTTAVSVLAQDEKQRPTKKITVCPVSLTESGRQSSFHFNFLYLVEISENGEASKIKEVLDHKRYPKFVRDELFVDCIKQWRLEPAGRYFVSFYVGTTSARSTQRITDPKKETIEICLMFCEPYKDKTSEKQ